MFLTDHQTLKLKNLEEKVVNSKRTDILGKGCTTSLIDIYSKQKYGKRKISGYEESVLSIANGTISEGNSLKMLSEFDNIDYKTHKETISNRYIKGIIDGYIGKSIKKCDKIIEVKTCNSLQSLLNNTQESVKAQYYWQIMGYMFITGATEGEICHCLVSYPKELIQSAKDRYLYKIRPLSLSSEYISEQLYKIENDMTFDEIPVNERIVRTTVRRNDEHIAMIKQKVKYCREWLNNFDKLHQNINK